MLVGKPPGGPLVLDVDLLVGNVITRRCQAMRRRRLQQLENWYNCRDRVVRDLSDLSKSALIKLGHELGKSTLRLVASV